MRLDLSTAPVLGFPLRGEWRAVNTPAERVPSHGTDFFAQRFAFDFVRLDETGRRFYDRGWWWHVFAAMSAAAFYSWNQPVHAAFGGAVIAAADDWPDREWVNVLWESARAAMFAVKPTTDDFRPLTGNHVLVQGEPGVALYAHLRRGSLAVRRGDRVAAGERLAAVGNSGNSTMPHLHFQLMDGPDPQVAAGRLCSFSGLERHVDDEWIPIAPGVPGLMDRIRR